MQLLAPLVRDWRIGPTPMVSLMRGGGRTPCLGRSPVTPHPINPLRKDLAYVGAPVLSRVRDITILPRGISDHLTGSGGFPGSGSRTLRWNPSLGVKWKHTGGLTRVQPLCGMPLGSTLGDSISPLLLGFRGRAGQNLLEWKLGRPNRRPYRSEPRSPSIMPAYNL